MIMGCNTRLGVVSGLRKEVDLLNIGKREPGVIAKVTGGRPKLAKQYSSDLIAEQCSALLSFGVAGGLSPDLRCGDVIIGDSVLRLNAKSIPTCEEWRLKLLSSLKGLDKIFVGPILGVDTVIGTSNQKLALYKKTSGLAVDMESYYVGKVAQEFDLPFLVIRVILDPVDFNIPSSATDVIDELGVPKYKLILSNLLKSPNELPKLMNLSQSLNIATSKLAKLNSLVGPYFCLMGD